MANLNDKAIRSGTFLKVWLDGIELSACYKCSGKMSRNKQTVQLPGQLWEGHKTTSVKGTGSLGTYDVDGYLEDLIAQEISLGVDPNHTLVVLNNDPDAKGSRRHVMTGVSFDEATPYDYEVGQLGKKEFPFTFTGEEFLSE